MIDFVGGADPSLARNPHLLAIAIALQASMVLLDAATVWILIRALGVTASAGGVFTSFMIASLFRTMGIVPGGLGTVRSDLGHHLADDRRGCARCTLGHAVVSWPELLAPDAAGLLVLTPHRGARRSEQGGPELGAYWSLDAAGIVRRLGSSPEGLSSADAARRLSEYGPNELHEHRTLTRAGVLLRQLRSPLLLLLVFAAAASALSGEWLDSAIVLTIVVATVGIGYSREYSAQTAAAALGARVRVRANVLRDGQRALVPIEHVVPGDVVLLEAGSLVPADCVILEATDCFVSEAVLTGESFPVEKRPGLVPAPSGLARRTNCVSLGTNVRSGTARCLVVKTGSSTEFGAIAHRLMLRPPETEFDRGIRRFGYLLTSAMFDHGAPCLRRAHVLDHLVCLRAAGGALGHGGRRPGAGRLHRRRPDGHRGVSAVERHVVHPRGGHVPVRRSRATCRSRRISRGDGRAELVVYRPDTGIWFGYNTVTAATTVDPFGVAGDSPALRRPGVRWLQRGDVDGDRRADPTVFRPSTGTWFTLPSSTGLAPTTATAWGASGDVPVPGDYRGVGRSQAAVFRPSTGTWFVQGGVTVAFGVGTDTPVPADYDGDGRTDVAVFRPSTGAWYVLTSSSGFTTVTALTWGASGDVPVPGDYDGDGQADPAVFRPSTGTLVCAAVVERLHDLVHAGVRDDGRSAGRGRLRRRRTERHRGVPALDRHLVCPVLVHEFHDRRDHRVRRERRHPRARRL